jgi:hypothetical protein
VPGTAKSLQQGIGGRGCICEKGDEASGVFGIPKIPVRNIDSYTKMRVFVYPYWYGVIALHQVIGIGVLDQSDQRRSVGLSKNILSMGLYRSFTDKEFFSDLLVGEFLGDKPEHIPLAVSQERIFFGWLIEVMHQQACNFRAHIRHAQHNLFEGIL